MAKRILVLSASVGAGHLRAAEAMELALKQLAPHAEVKNVDLLDLTNAAFRRVYGKLYIDLVNRAPHVLGLVYDMLDKKPSDQHKTDRMRLMIEKMNLGKFLKLLQGEPWDVIVNTHFLPAEIIASLTAQGKFNTPHVTVTTDFETHRMWVNQPCNHYFTATDEGAAYLHYWGIPREHISVTGIPIHPVFSEEKDAAACRQRLGLAGDRPVIVQMAGGFGMGPVEKIFSFLLSIERPLEIVVVAGKNADLKARLESTETPERHRVHVLGFTREVDELMAAADIVISKPGGLTTSEVLARGAAMLVANPVPGRETRNSDFVLENGAGMKVNNIPTLGHKLSRLLDDPSRLQQMKAASRRLGRPRAAFDIAQAVLGF